MTRIQHNYCLHVLKFSSPNFDYVCIWALNIHTYQKRIDNHVVCTPFDRSKANTDNQLHLLSVFVF